MVCIFFFQTLDKTCWAILNKPRPKVEVPKVEDPVVSSESSDEQKPAPSPQSADKKPNESGMDVD